jgi:hypothetical protein
MLAQGFVQTYIVAVGFRPLKPLKAPVAEPASPVVTLPGPPCACEGTGFMLNTQLRYDQQHRPHIERAAMHTSGCFLRLAFNI